MSVDTLDDVVMKPGAVTPGSSAPPSRKAVSSAGASGKVLRRLLNNPYWIYGLLRFVAPVFRIPFTQWHVVTRFGHVKEILANSEVFRVPWDQKVIELNDGGSAFVLGLDEPHAHRAALRQLMQGFKREDIGQVATIASEEAEAIIRAHIATAGPRQASVPPFDAIRDLVIRVPTRICRRYFGLPILEQQEDEFARWSMDISSYLFGDPLGDPTIREKALSAAGQMRSFLDRAIVDARTGPVDDATVLGRLVAMPPQEGGPSDEAIRAHIMGMVTGFVPTDTIAAGHMLDVLIGNGRFQTGRRTRFTKPVMRAIEDNDDQQLTKCLFETLRFLPINPGPFRICSQTYEVQGGGWFGRGSRTIPADARLIASTQSAMFDRRAVERPYRFDPSRRRAEYMLLGSGHHACVGIHLAEAQITQTLKALLRQKKLRRVTGEAGQLQRDGPFPAHLMVQFDQ
jgi:cytochrome P450